MLAVQIGLLSTLFLGRFCTLFLDKSVAIKYPDRLKLEALEPRGGGKQLGVLETIFFTAPFWARDMF